MFTKVKATNFISWESLDFDFEKGITLLQGWNYSDNRPEGSGKSAVATALVWGLFGRTPRDVNVNDVIQTGKPSCKVEVVLNDNHVIVRERNPNQLYILDPNGNTIKGMDAKETQKIIENFIGVSFNTFCQTVYFPQNSFNRFISANEEERAKIFSELQDLTQFDKARKKVVEDLNTANTDLVLKQREYDLTENLFKNQMVTIQGLEELKTSFEQDRQKEITDINNNIRELEKKLDSFPESIKVKSSTDELEEYQLKLSKINEKIIQDSYTKAKIKEIQNQILTLQVSVICPTCGQQETAESKVFKRKEMDKQMDIIHSLKKTLSKEDLQEEVKKFKSIIEEHSNTYLLFRQNQYDRDKIETNIAYLMEQLDNLSYKSSVDIDKQIAENNQNSLATGYKLEDLDNIIIDNKKVIQHLETLKDSFKEIKQYVFQSLLFTLNNAANTYLVDLFDVPVTVEFTNITEDGGMGKIELKIMYDGQERSYGLMSGGQAKRLEIATNLALSDLLIHRSGTGLNLRIFDESFHNLSFESMSKIIILLTKFKNNVIILVSHDPLIKGIVDRVFEIEYRDGVSRKI